MQAEDHLRAGDLDQALSSLEAEVRSNPAKPELRVFLFQLLSVLGEWDRAMTQLNVVADMNADCMLMAQVCRPALNCEALRRDIFAGRRSPMIFGEPAEWVVWLTQVLPLLAQGQDTAAVELRDRAFEAAPTLQGSIDGHPFAWIADADSRMGPVLEAIIEGRYYWLPFQNIRDLRIEEPKDLRDIVWIPAHFTWTNGGQSVGFIPSRYPGSEASQDNGVRMARRTEWIEREGGIFLGMGQRLFVTDEGEHSLLQTRHIVMGSPEAEKSEEERTSG